MNIYSIPSLISAVFLLTTGLISLLYGIRGKVNTIFAIYVFLLSLSAFADFFYQNAYSPEVALHWVRITVVFSISALSVLIHYILLLSGYSHQLNKKVWGVSLRVYLIFLYIYGAALLVLSVFTNLIISGIEIVEPHGFKHIFGSLFYLMVTGILLFTVTIIAILYKGYRKATSELKRIKLRYNLVGISLIYLSVIFLIIYLPYQGFQTYPYAFIPITISAIIFYALL